MPTDAPIVFPRLPIKTVKELPGECCEKCRFLHVLMVEGPGKQIVEIPVCRRFPPTMCFTMQPAQLPPGMLPKRGEPLPMQPQTMPLFPQVNFESWCGEFSAKPAKAD